jgi:hypothetical protein
MFSGNQTVLSWPQHQSNRSSVIKDLLEKSSFVDVTLVCDDDEQIQAHKVILSASSAFFLNIFDRNPHNHPLLYFHGSKKKDMLALVDFIYSGQTSVSVDDLESFLRLAKNLQVKGLINDATSEDNEGAESDIKTEKDLTTTMLSEEPMGALDIEIDDDNVSMDEGEIRGEYFTEFQKIAFWKSFLVLMVLGRVFPFCHLRNVTNLGKFSQT